jgi:hypothetical protein
MVTVANSFAMMADASTDYQIHISMSEDTANQLLGSKYYLYGFKAVQSTKAEGAPLVWFKTQRYSTINKVSWSKQYQAYTSQNDIIPGGVIDASHHEEISLGQTFRVEKSGGTGSVVNGGRSTAISILNNTTTAFTCGIAEMQNGIAQPVCAFPLTGKAMNVIAPLEKVLLMFATEQVNTGSVIERAYSFSILIDLTSDNHREVTFDINQGWSWGGYSWAQEIEANSKLVPLLIESSTGFERGSLVLP